jgi:hypothetical protein
VSSPMALVVGVERGLGPVADASAFPFRGVRKAGSGEVRGQVTRAKQAQGRVAFGFLGASRTAAYRWGNRPASLWIAEDFGCCASG